MPVTVLGANGLGRDSDIIEGLVWAVDHHADVALMSFSASGYSSALQAAIDYAWAHGVVVVAATGNDGSSSPAFPAGDRGVIGVSITDRVRRAARRRPTTATTRSLRPRATEILTHVRGRRLRVHLGHVRLGGRGRGRGGAAARRRSVRCRTASIVGRLAATADAAGTAAETGNGRLNLGRALTVVAGTPTQPAGAAPVGSGGPFVGPYVIAAAVQGISVSAQSPSSVSPGGSATYTVSVNMNGNATAVGVILDVFPAVATVTPSFSDGGTCRSSDNNNWSSTLDADDHRIDATRSDLVHRSRPDSYEHDVRVGTDGHRHGRRNVDGPHRNDDDDYLRRSGSVHRRRPVHGRRQRHPSLGIRGYRRNGHDL